MRRGKTRNESVAEMRSWSSSYSTVLLYTSFSLIFVCTCSRHMYLYMTLLVTTRQLWFRPNEGIKVI